MIRIYDMRNDGVYLPVRYYTNLDKKSVVLVGVVHEGERIYYQRIQSILEMCDTVIYEEPHIREAETLRQLEETWAERLYYTDPDEAFLAAIFLPVPQQFMRDHNLYDETDCFAYDNSSHNWISGDGDWGKGKEDAGLPLATWDCIMDNVRSMSRELKQQKVTTTRRFLEKVNKHSASMLDYLDFRNLYEDEIQDKVFQSTLVDPRDEMVFEVFDRIIYTGNPSRIGIEFGNGHLPHMDQLLRERGYRCTTAKWLRALTINASSLEEAMTHERV